MDRMEDTREVQVVAAKRSHCQCQLRWAPNMIHCAAQNDDETVK